jgi:hypothetical protein
MQCVADVLYGMVWVSMQRFRHVDLFALNRVFVEWWPSAFPASSSGGLQSRVGAFPYDVTLELSKRTKEVKDELAAWCGGVHVFSQTL